MDYAGLDSETEHNGKIAVPDSLVCLETRHAAPVLLCGQGQTEKFPAPCPVSTPKPA